MVKAVRVFARQQMPNYRKSASFIIKESYPLPPYSSVIGLVHALCGWKEYHPMRVSIQGGYASTVNDYAINYAFGSIPADRAWAGVDAAGGEAPRVARMPRSYEVLTDVELLLHIIPEDKTLTEEIFAAFNAPPIYPSLGRHEDLLQIESLTIVELEPAVDSVVTHYDAYVPETSIDAFESKNIVGTLYRLGKVFEYDNGKERSSKPGNKSIRVWKQSITARHICKKVQVAAADGVFYDRQNDEAVFPA